MRKLSIFFIILLGLFVLTISACQSIQDVPVPTSPVLVPSKTASPIAEEPLAGTSVPRETPTFSYSATVFEETVALVDTIQCGETFCQVAWAGFLNRPIEDGYRNTIDRTYPYASTRNGTLEIHHGVEFVNSSGTPVLAAQSGEVVYAGNDMQTRLGPYYGFYGNLVILKHPELYQGEDIFTLYAHLSAMDVEVGDQVNIGDRIGKVGASGAAVGSHLHFEVRVGQNDYNHTVNPILWFAPVISSDAGQSTILSGIITDRDGNSIPDLPLALERLSIDGGIESYVYTQTYLPTGINAFPDLGENFVIPDILPGEYRLAFVYGTLYERTFSLEPGQLGFIEIQLN